MRKKITGNVGSMGQDMGNGSEIRRRLRPIQTGLRSIGLKRYLMIALEFDDFAKVSISILRRWRGLTEARVAKVVSLFVELGHLLKLISFQSVSDVYSAPLRFPSPPSSSSEAVLTSGLVTSLLYKDDSIAIGEVPITKALYECGIRKPLVYACTGGMTQHFVMGVLGEPPALEIIPQLTASLHDFLDLFEAGSLEKVGIPMSTMLLQDEKNGEL